jgi:hypothetical protein
VDAGAEFTVRCQLRVLPGRDHVDLGVSIRDTDDVELAYAELVQCDGQVYVTEEIQLEAPLAVGECVLRAVLVTPEQDGTSPNEMSTEFAFVVKAHAMRLNVWGLPAAITAGERFTFNIGIKCSAGCGLTGRELIIVNGEGDEVGTATLRDDVWPGTGALYFAEAVCDAPLAVGSQRWEARIAASGSGVPHAAGAHAFSVRIVDPPDCEVTVEAFDAARQTPIGNARVVMHPYRAFTGENGVATLKVVKGNYSLLVSGTRYMGTTRTLEVRENITVRADLILEPPDDYTTHYTV